MQLRPLETMEGMIKVAEELERLIPEVDEAFHIETHGIDIISPQERHGSPRQLFWVWISATFTISNVIIGQLFPALGLSLWDSLAVAVICSISYVAVGLSSIQGPVAGTATLTISRASFGVRGNVIPALLSWVVLVGWESVTVVLTVTSLLLVAQLLHLPHTGAVVTLAAMGIALILTFSVPILGHATIMKMQRILAYAMGVFVLVMIPLILPKVNWAFAPSSSHLAAHGVLATFVLACSIGIMGSSLSWPNYASDYSRYFPADTPPKAIIKYTTLGAGIGSFIFMSLGILLGSFVSPALFSANPMLGTMGVLPVWYAFPFLFLVVVGQIANNYMNSYSSSMSFLAMGVHLPRYWSVVIDAVISSLIALYALFLAPGFLSFFENFLSLSILFLGPWTGIFITHYFLFRGRYDSPSLVTMSAKNRYWYSKGANPAGFIALITGAFAAFWTVNSALWVSPFSTHFLGSMDLSAFVGPIVASAVYYILMHQTAAAAEQPAISQSKIL